VETPPISLSLLKKWGITIPTGKKLLSRAEEGVLTAKRYLQSLLLENGKINLKKLDSLQSSAHALAVMATYLQCMKEMLTYAEKMEGYGEERALEVAEGLSFIGIAAQEIENGIDLGTLEKVYIKELGLDPFFLSGSDEEIKNFIHKGTSHEMIASMAKAIEERGDFGEFCLEDETLLMIRDQFRKFVEQEVLPISHTIHLQDRLIPLSLINKMAEMGVFGLTIPESYGGAGLSKMAMVVVTEELSRGYIGVGSIGTRAEIAGELILHGGTEEQKRKYLPKIARGEILPTAVFTEPQYGSDLAHLKTRAERCPGGFKIYGQKTWITHASRADLMTILVRTNPQFEDHRGLSILLGEKTRIEKEEGGFELPGLSATELKVLGYRGMKEYELSLDGFFVPEENLLGGKEGEGFKQLMRTFESARIQTAARAVGVARSALEAGFRYAQDRIQFGKKIYSFPRVYGKIVKSAILTQGARQLTYFSARQKDSGKRCDLEAGMAKLFSCWIAFQVADAMLQIHGGNGYSLEFPISRIFCDARVLTIFEGASEIQAQVIARRLLEE
jgi:(2S)-methylsuccinyl-CoA dehydrogenase